ncbi:MAG: cohesin domain-containing protein [Methanophagales archaeon]|nr:cohesin domain-containing protein [Methanophagales archaeon]
MTPAAAQPVKVWVNAPEYVEEGTTFIATIAMNDVTDLNAAQFDLTFNKSVLKVSDVKEGEIGGVNVPILMWALNPDKDAVRVLPVMPIGAGVSGSGYLAKISFAVVGKANGKLNDNS